MGRDGLAVLPFPLAPDYGRSPQVVLADPATSLTVIVPAIALILLVWHRRSAHLYLVCFLLFALSLLPTSRIVPFYFQQTSTVADRYFYFPAVWVSVAVATFLETVTAKARWGFLPTFVEVAIGGVFAGFLAGVWQTTPYRKESRTFCNWMFEQNPASYEAQHCLGALEQNLKKYPEALVHYQKALELAPWLTLTPIHIAEIQFEIGRGEQANKTLQNLIAHYPTNTNVQAAVEQVLSKHQPQNRDPR